MPPGWYFMSSPDEDPAEKLLAGKAGVTEDFRDFVTRGFQRVWHEAFQDAAVPITAYAWFPQRAPILLDHPRIRIPSPCTLTDVVRYALWTLDQGSMIRRYSDDIQMSTWLTADSDPLPAYTYRSGTGLPWPEGAAGFGLKLRGIFTQYAITCICPVNTIYLAVEQASGKLYGSYECIE